MHFDVHAIRQDFPILNQTVHDRPLVYLDNAATTQKPHAVIERLNQFYQSENANIHRGIHHLSEQATLVYEHVRDQVAQWIHASCREEIVFVKGVTEGINLVAQTYGRSFLQPGEEILITEMEHHANIVPWQMLCAETGAVLRVVPIHDDGVLDLHAYEHMLHKKTRLVAITQVSNVLGTVNPIQHIVAMAHQHGVPVLVDGAQAVAHEAINVQEMDCDFYLFSGHKMYGPTGIGVLYAQSSWLEKMPPYQGGGDMISRVDFEHSTFRAPPHKFEAGTPHIAGVVGLGAAIDYIQQYDLAEIKQHEQRLLAEATQQLSQIPGLRIFGQAPDKGAIIAFTVSEIHPHDIATLLDQQGIAVRAGHHCAMPLTKRLGLSATTRVSFACYNTLEEIDRLVDSIHRVQDLFHHG